MGMDVYGRKPTTEDGKYFRNNVWWWRPLADYIVDVAPRALTGKCKYWQSNDGAGLNAKESLRLAVILREEIASGRCKEFADLRARDIAAMPRLICEWCEGFGIRTDAVGVR